jgi:hypothetical protein
MDRNQFVFDMAESQMICDECWRAPNAYVLNFPYRRH